MNLEIQEQIIVDIICKRNINNIRMNLVAKYIQTFIDYNIPSNEWEYRIYKIRTYKPSDSVSLGKIFYSKGISCLPDYKKSVESRIQNLDNMIKKYGEKLGRKKWDEFREKVSYNSSKDGLIQRYGKEKAEKICYARGASFRRSDIQRANSLKYVQKYSKEEKQSQSPRCSSYWIKKGFSEVEAKEKVKEVQTNFSLNKCIEKYGVDEGIEIFQDRQNRWQETLNSKSEEEKDRINKSRGTDKYGNPHVGGYTWENIHNYISTPGVLYYMRFWNDDIEYWKIGITKNIDNRWNTDEVFHLKYNLYKEIIFVEELSIFEAFVKEQNILKKYNRYRRRFDYNGFSSTEMFCENVLDIT